MSSGDVDEVRSLEVLAKSWFSQVAEGHDWPHPPDLVRLNQAMRVALERAVEAEHDSRDGFGIELGAWAAFTFLRDAPQIVGITGPEHANLTVGIAYRLAVDVAETFGGLTLREGVDDQRAMFKRLTSLRDRLAQGGVREDRPEMNGLAWVLRKMIGPESTGSQKPQPAPSSRRWQWRQRAGTLHVGATKWINGASRHSALRAGALGGVVLLVGAGAFAVGHLTAPGQPTSGASATPGQAQPVPAVFASLPNTDVTVKAINGDEHIVTAGALPSFPTVVIPMDLGITFEVAFTKRHLDQPSDVVQFFVNGIAPATIDQSHRMRNAAETEGDNLGDLSDPLTVKGLPDDGSPVVYQFHMTATRAVNIGYWCGYNPKPVTVVVIANNNPAGATVPYPVSVSRDC